MTFFLSICFIALAVLAVGMIVVTKNVIHAAYSLVVVLVSLAVLFVFLNASFLAAVQILLYAAGVVILLIFGVMLTHRLKGEKLISKTHFVGFGSIIALAIFCALIWLFSKFLITETISTLPSTDPVKEIGISFLTEHLVAFELIGFILLVVLVGATFLAKTSSHE